MGQTYSAAVPVVRAREATLAEYVWVTAVIMSLGWGLRGYIGGGPLGAMIPGVFVALLFCLYLGYGTRAAAVAAAFGAIGVGFGGEMTYGQTIGLAREAETFAWGMIGLTLKGAIWGLLGGAFLGLGMAWRDFDRRRLPMAFACFLVACFAGLAIINEPKLIYFSNRLDRPRDESWAGLLFGAIAFLAYLSLREKKVAAVCRRFALYGLIGGGIGFGGGGLFMALGQDSGAPGWIPWWKFMEFTFGFIFGAALGLCAHSLRDDLRPAGAAGPQEGPSMGAALGAIALVAAALVLWPLLGVFIEKVLEGAPAAGILRPAGRTLFGFVGLGCLLLILAARSETAAWQVAATITFLATVIDLQEDFGPEGSLPVHTAIRVLLIVVALLASVAAVVYWQRRPQRRLSTLLLVLMWALMAVAHAKPVLRGPFLFPTADDIDVAGGMFPYYVDLYEGRTIVHGVFTAFALASTAAILAWRRRSTRNGDSRKDHH